MRDSGTDDTSPKHPGLAGTCGLSPNSLNSLDWKNHRGLPRFARAVLSALRFDHADLTGLRELTGEEWPLALDFCDRAQLTLTMGRLAAEVLPEAVRERIRGNREANRERLSRVWNAYREIAGTFRAARLPFAVLKGFTLYPRFCADLESRVQYDIDFITEPAQALRAVDLLAKLGYEPLAQTEDFPTDHLPAMIRKSGWEWRGDFFDPEIPVSVDLHFRFWDQATERIPAPGAGEFWSRRTEAPCNGDSVPCLQPLDALGYACLHLLRHLLRGSVKIAHVYELAHFLERHAEDDGFWQQWRQLHPAPLRRLQAVGFQLAAAWFSCRLPQAAREEVEDLPEETRVWFDRHAAAAAEAMFRPNKAELWLHMSLLESWRDRFSVLRRRLLPGRLPGPVDAVYVPDEKLTRRMRVRRSFKYFAYLCGRALFHLRCVPPLLGDGILLWHRRRELGGGFRTLLWASSLLNLGMFIFALLYNLYLLDLGFDERWIGWINGAAVAGGIAGTLPAGWCTRRFGLRATAALGIGGLAIFSALRAAVTGSGAALPLAFLSGAAFAGWAVSIAPAISGLTIETKRARAFSIFFSCSIALGIVGGWLGGHLPGWLGSLHPGASPAALKRAAMLAGCGLSAAALWPVLRLRLSPAAAGRGRVYPRGRFIHRYLIAFGLWNLATGAFNPLYNVYFAKILRASTQTIGSLFSVAQMAQVLALLAAPAVLRKLGLAGGISAMMVTTGVTLLCLAGAPGLATAAAVYAAYMAFQWMSEPGMGTLLMNRVKVEERGGASALNYLVAFLAQALAASAAGAIALQAGFPTLLLGASALAFAAGLMFLALPADRTIATAPSLRESSSENAPR